MTDEDSTSETQEKDVIEHNQTEILAENLMLKATVDGLEQKLKEVTESLDSAKEQLEAQTRSTKVQRILMVSDLGMGYLAKKSLDELDEIEELYKHAKKPYFKSTGDSSRYADAYDQVLYKLNNKFKFGKKD